MSRIAQRLANSYPIWSKIRNDPSSVGQRFFSAFEPMLAYQEAELVKVREETRLMKRGLGLESLWSIGLEEQDFVEPSYTKNGIPVVEEFTSVTGILGGNPIVVTHTEIFEDFVWGPPTRLSLKGSEPITSIEVWDSGTPDVFQTIDSPNWLTVMVQDSKHYRATPTTRVASNKWFIRLEGKDLNGLPVTEILYIRDDGPTQTQHIYSELDAVDKDGFDGQITIYCGYSSLPVIDPFRSLPLVETEGPMWLERDGDSFVKVYTKSYPDGWDYRNGLDEVVDHIEEHISLALMDSGENLIGLVDFTVCPDTTLLYTVDTSGIIRVYDHDDYHFRPPPIPPTLESYLSILPMYPYAKLGAKEPLWTWFRQPKAKIVSVEIKRISPSGTTSYLGPGKVWQPTPYAFRGLEGSLPEDTWQDFRFENTYNESGQWDFYISVKTILGGELTVSHTSVLVPALEPLAELDPSIPGTPVGIWFDHNGDLVVLDTTNTLHRITPHRDRYYIDTSSQRVYLRERYDSLELEK